MNKTNNHTSENKEFSAHSDALIIFDEEGEECIECKLNVSPEEYESFMAEITGKRPCRFHHTKNFSEETPDDSESDE